MSTEIELYRDEEIEISITSGGWGFRIHIGEPLRKGATKEAFGKYAEALLTVASVDEMIVKLSEIKEQLTDEI